MMIADQKSIGPTVDSQLPNSKKIYVFGQIHTDVRVPFREISLTPTKTISGEIEVNEPVRVYDTSGPWGDVPCCCDVERGLKPLRRDWILKRGDVEEIAGREVQPIDDGFLSAKHAVHAARATVAGIVDPGRNGGTSSVSSE